LSGFTAQIECVTRSGTVLAQDLSVSAAAGEAVAVIGSNGAGKSVLLRASALLDLADSGNVQLGASRWDFVSGVLQPCETPPWPTLTMALQTPGLWPHLTVRQNLEAWKRFGLDRRKGRLAADYLVDRFNLKPLLEKRPSHLSGGEAQRVALARTLSLPCEVAFLDEPNNALDVEYAQILIEILRDFKRMGGIVILASHSAGLVKAIGDTFVFLKNGRIKERGRVPDLDAASTQDLRVFWGLMSGQVIQAVQAETQ